MTNHFILILESSNTVGINMEVSKARASPEGGLIPGSKDLQKMRRSTS